MVHIKIQWPQKRSRQIPESGINMIRECQNLCPEAIAVRQYVNKVPDAELPERVIQEGFKLRTR